MDKKISIILSTFNEALVIEETINEIFHNVKNAYSRMESLLQEFEFSSFDNFFQNTPKKFSSII